jgi:hypothetical protein
VRAPKVPPEVDLRRVVTRFGIVELPKTVKPEELTAEDILDDPRIRLVPDRDLTSAERSLVERLSVDALPKLNPRPPLTEAQVCYLYVVAELERRGEPFGWDQANQHFATVRDIRRPLRSCNSQRAGESLVRRGMLMDCGQGPRLTKAGKVRVEEQAESMRLRERLGVREYPVLRLVKHDRYRAYDEIYVTKDGKERCFFRYETLGFRCSSIVLVAEHWDD